MEKKGECHTATEPCHLYSLGQVPDTTCPGLNKMKPSRSTKGLPSDAGEEVGLGTLSPKASITRDLAGVHSRGSFLMSPRTADHDKGLQSSHSKGSDKQVKLYVTVTETDTVLFACRNFIP